MHLIINFNVKSIVDTPFMPYSVVIEVNGLLIDAGETSKPAKFTICIQCDGPKGGFVWRIDPAVSADNAKFVAAGLDMSNRYERMVDQIDKLATARATSNAGRC